MEPIHLDDNNFSDVISKGYTLVDFWADWCGPCKMVAPVIEELANDYDGRVTVAKLDTDAHSAYAIAHRITGIPTVVLFHNGTEIDRLVGARTKDAYTEVLDKHITARV